MAGHNHDVIYKWGYYQSYKVLAHTQLVSICNHLPPGTHIECEEHEKRS